MNKMISEQEFKEKEREWEKAIEDIIIDASLCLSPSVDISQLTDAWLKFMNDVRARRIR